MDAGYDYAKMFIVKDKLCDGTKWHIRTVPENPAVDPYFPIGQASLNLVSRDGKLNVILKTLTPNFKEYQARMDGSSWKPAKAEFAWSPHPGANRVEARTVNQFGITGPVSTVELDLQ